MLQRDSNRLRKSVEAACFALSLALLLYYGLVTAARQGQARADVTRFERALVQNNPPGPQAASYEQMQPDFSEWSAARKKAYSALVGEAHGDQPIAILDIDSIQLKVPIYPDSSEDHLNLGAGVIDGMAAPGDGGNVGIAGHRDGFFRVLKNVSVGDSIGIRTKDRHYRYRISAITIVDENDHAVLRDTVSPTLTLVTCYPFYYQGHAPQRYIVQATFEKSSS